MLKLATVFSGIGAIEHALERMDIPFEIEFACDSGDVNIFSKKVPFDLYIISKELSDLSNIIKKDKKNYIKFKKLKHKYEEAISMIEEIYDIRFVEYMSDIIEYICINDDIKNSAFIKEFEILSSYEDYYKFSKLIFLIKKIDKYLLKNNFIEKDILNLKINFCNNFIENDVCVKHTKLVKDLAERISMLYEEIEIQNLKEKLDALTSPNDKKKYIDEVYNPFYKQNKVMQSYLANYNLTKEKFYWNVSFLDGSIYNKKIDLFVGGSPCQSFSLVGKQRGLEDTRGTLFYEFARLVKEIEPKIFIYENVKAILSNDDGKTWDTMTRVFNQLEYKTFPIILNAKNYGIPQNRERVFVIGFRKDIQLVGDYIPPKEKKLNKTMKDFLLDNVSGKYYLNKKGVSFVTDEKNIKKRYTQIDGEIQLCQKKNQQFNWHGDFVFVEENKNKEQLIKDLERYFLSEKVVKYVLSTGTKGFYSKPKTDLDIARPLLTSMHKMHRAGIDNYVTTDGRLRKLTPRECLRLMGFCDSFKIVVSDTAMYQQAGNSIVVDVLIAIINSINDVYPLLLKGNE